MGRVEDLFIGVEAGIDTFDCVIPTREARHGGIWTRNGRIDVKRSKGAVSLDEGCECPACSEGVTREGLRDLFKEKNQDAGRFATLHNVYFFNDLMRKIRNTIREGGDLGVLRKEYGV
jgi:queuine tRNA-ribosyltransferase